MTFKKGDNKGKTFEEIYGIVKAKEIIVKTKQKI